MESEYQRAARLKWPRARIVGDGAYALYCQALEIVHLHSGWIFAATAVNTQHGNWNCVDSHRLFELEPARARRAVTRNLADAFPD